MLFDIFKCMLKVLETDFPLVYSSKTDRQDSLGVECISPNIVIFHYAVDIPRYVHLSLNMDPEYTNVVKQLFSAHGRQFNVQEWLLYSVLHEIGHIYDVYETTGFKMEALPSYFAENSYRIREILYLPPRQFQEQYRKLPLEKKADDFAMEKLELLWPSARDLLPSVR